MKRITFGYKGGFPLEQETLIHIQRAYADDMLEALLTQWSIDPNKTYLLKDTNSEDEDGWLITTIERNEIDPQTGAPFPTPILKPELLRLKFSKGADTSRIEIIDLRSQNGTLNYADGVERKVYEEWIARYSNTGEIDTTDDGPEGSFLRLSKIEDLLPRDGSKPMTGNLVLGENEPVLTPGEEGNRLYFRGTYANTDDVWMSKHTPSQDVTELRVRLGDNVQSSSKDAFIIGGANSSSGETWKEQFRVQTDGKVGIKVPDPELNLDVDAENKALKFRNLASVSSPTPLVIDSQGNVGRSTSGAGSFEPGMVMMWSGTTPPLGWALCDGNNGGAINGIIIPDLRGRFVIGTGTRKEIVNNKGNLQTNNTNRSFSLNSKSGSDTVILSEAQLPAHDHTGTTGSAGSHSHPYRDGYYVESSTGGIDGNEIVSATTKGSGDTDNDNRYMYYKNRTTSSSGSHTHTLNIGNAGSNGAHDNLPPYYTLAFIIYVGEFSANPIVSAGNDQTITLPSNSITLTGTASDPDGTVSNVLWTKVSGGSANIVNANSLSTQVTGLVQGSYVFRLTATDNEGSTGVDTVSITVRANTRPTVSAGLDQTITLPTNSVTLRATASDPDGTITTFRWSKVSGGNANFSNQNSPTTTVSGLVQGSYTFRITVTDNGGATSSDDVRVTVSSSSTISVTPTDLGIISRFGDIRTVTINSNTNWRVENSNGVQSISPQTGNSGTTSVRLTIPENPFTGDGELLLGFVFFETTDGADTASVSWGQESGGILDPLEPACFDLESNILMASGRNKKLRNVVVGDELSVYNFKTPLASGNEELTDVKTMFVDASKTSVKVTDIATSTVDSYRMITLVNGTILNVTPTHPLLASKDQINVVWLLPDDLRAGVFLVDKDGKLVEIESKRTINESLEIGILQVSGTDNYFVQGVMVHNPQIVRAEVRLEGDITATSIATEDQIAK